MHLVPSTKNIPEISIDNTKIFINIIFVVTMHTIMKIVKILYYENWSHTVLYFYTFVVKNSKFKR